MNGSDATRAVVEEWVRRFNSHDVGQLVALYAPDARHTSPRIRELHPETGGYLVGREALTQWWQAANARTPGLHYRQVALVAEADRAVLEYVRTAPGEPDSTVAERFVVQDGRIVDSQVFLG